MICPNCGLLKSNEAMGTVLPMCQCNFNFPRWSKEKEMFASWEYPQKTYADGIEECAQRAESYAYMSPNFTALAEEFRAILKKASER